MASDTPQLGFGFDCEMVPLSNEVGQQHSPCSMAEGAAHVLSFLGLEAVLHWSILEERWAVAVARPKAKSHRQGFPASFLALIILIIVIIGIVFIALNGGFDPLGKPFGNVIILVLIYRRKRTTRDEMDKPVAGKTADDQPRANQSSGRATHASATNPLRRARA